MSASIKFYISALCFLVVLLSGCTKESMDTIEDDPLPEIGLIPSLEILSISSTELRQYQDSLTFVVQYQDGDGDIGTTDPDDTVVEVVDQRNPELLVFNFHVSPRAPLESTITIQGTLDIVLNNTILIDQNNTTETTTFKIRMQDRAGNWSDAVETAEITILK